MVRGGPDSKQLAGIGLLSGLLVLGLFGLAWLTRENSDWPTERSDNLLLIGVLVVGLLPVALVLIHALIRRGGKLSFQGITIDLGGADPRAVEFRIDTNIGVEGEAVSDSSSARILDALEKAAETDVIVVDLEDGKAWWETRLLILVAGAVRIGRPRSIVFVASTAQQKRFYLGWAPPGALLEALLSERNPRHSVYLKSYGLALETGEKWQESIERLGPHPAAGVAPAPPPDLPPVSAGWNWASWVAWDGSRANPFATEQFLALALGNELEETWKASPFPADPKASSAEKFPGAVTVTQETLDSQFAGKLHRVAIEETAGSDDQVDAFLIDSGEFAPITRSGSYLRLASRSALLNGLVQQLLISSRNDRG
jgi:hypothetical protein